MLGRETRDAWVDTRVLPVEYLSTRAIFLYRTVTGFLVPVAKAGVGRSELSWLYCFTAPQGEETRGTGSMGPEQVPSLGSRLVKLEYCIMYSSTRVSNMV